jgi:hypothetical protein
VVLSTAVRDGARRCATTFARPRPTLHLGTDGSPFPVLGLRPLVRIPPLAGGRARAGVKRRRRRPSLRSYSRTTNARATCAGARTPSRGDRAPNGRRMLFLEAIPRLAEPLASDNCVPLVHSAPVLGVDREPDDVALRLGSKWSKRPVDPDGAPGRWRNWRLWLKRLGPSCSRVAAPNRRT